MYIYLYLKSMKPTISSMISSNMVQERVNVRAKSTNTVMLRIYTEKEYSKRKK